MGAFIGGISFSWRIFDEEVLWPGLPLILSESYRSDNEGVQVAVTYIVFKVRQVHRSIACFYRIEYGLLKT